MFAIISPWKQRCHKALHKDREQTDKKTNGVKTIIAHAHLSSIVKQRDVPSRAEHIQKLRQGTRPFWKHKSEENLIWKLGGSPNLQNETMQISNMLVIK